MFVFDENDIGGFAEWKEQKNGTPKHLLRENNNIRHVVNPKGSFISFGCLILGTVPTIQDMRSDIQADVVNIFLQSPFFKFGKLCLTIWTFSAITTQLNKNYSIMQKCFQQETFKRTKESTWSEN